MGDGILAYFGYPQAHEEDAERAVRAGLELIEAAAKLDDGEGTALHMRVAIATGLVVVGDLRSGGVVQEHDGRPPPLGRLGYCVNLVSSLAGIVVPDQGAGDRSPGFDGQMDQGPERGIFGALRRQWR
jgi:class 3 adenylate cyclase